MGLKGFSVLFFLTFGFCGGIWQDLTRTKIIVNTWSNIQYWDRSAPACVSAQDMYLAPWIVLSITVLLLTGIDLPHFISLTAITKYSRSIRIVADFLRNFRGQLQFPQKRPQECHVFKKFSGPSLVETKGTKSQFGRSKTQNFGLKPYLSS